MDNGWYWHCYQRKLGSNLPSYGCFSLNEGWCEILHHIAIRSMRLDSMQAGVQSLHQITSDMNLKCEAILTAGWCESWHHITIQYARLYATQGGVKVYMTYHITIRSVRLDSMQAGVQGLQHIWIRIVRSYSIRFWTSNRIGSFFVFCDAWLLMCA